VRNFADRLVKSIREKGTPLCVGLDPRYGLVPKEISEVAESPVGALWAFNQEVIDIAAKIVPAVKVQVAFYERHGWEGMEVFAETLRYARESGLLVVADVKRGDIGSTAEAYAEAYLRWDSPFSADAITVSPYLGEEGVKPFVEAAAEEGRGVFVLVRTSNASSDYVQDFGEEKLYLRVARLVRELGEGSVGDCGYSAVGAVVGATQKREMEVLRGELPNTFFLVPGYGAQGASAEDVAAAFDAEGLGAIVNSSRAIIHSYGDPEEKGWRESIRWAMERSKEELSGCSRGTRANG
jgi:orotidine-5'-phosphate decarboxylase